MHHVLGGEQAAGIPPDVEERLQLVHLVDLEGAHVAVGVLHDEEQIAQPDHALLHEVRQRRGERAVELVAGEAEDHVLGGCRSCHRPRLSVVCHYDLTRPSHPVRHPYGVKRVSNPGSAVCLMGDHPDQEEDHEVPVADPPGRCTHPSGPRGVGVAVRSGPAGVYADYQAVNGTPGSRPAWGWTSPDRDDGPGPGREDPRHGRAVRGDQGSRRRLPLLRGRRPRRRHRAGRPGSPPPGSGAPSRSVPRWSGSDPRAAFREQWAYVLAASVGFLGDFDLAEEATQEAFAIAAERWERDGPPSNPRAWLVTTARHRALPDPAGSDARRQDAPARSDGRHGRWPTHPAISMTRPFGTSAWS